MSAQEQTFWGVSARCELLIDCSRAIKRTSKYSEERLEKYFLNAGIQIRPQARKMRRMHNGEQFGVHDFHEYSGWLAGLMLFVRDEGQRRLVGDDVLGLLEGLAADFENSVGRPADEIANSGPRVPPSADEWIIFSTLLQRYLFIRSDDLARVRECFFTGEPKGDVREELRFRMYRYHSTIGRIAKSFTTIHGPTPMSQVCTFANFFKESAAVIEPRRASGIILPMGSVLHFVGEIDRGKGLKIMTIERPDRHKFWYSGLLQSFDGATVPIASRFVIRQTEDVTHDTVGIGIYDEADLAEEITEFRNELLNVGPREISANIYGRYALRA